VGDWRVTLGLPQLESASKKGAVHYGVGEIAHLEPMAPTRKFLLPITTSILSQALAVLRNYRKSHLWRNLHLQPQPKRALHQRNGGPPSHLLLWIRGKGNRTTAIPEEERTKRTNLRLSVCTATPSEGGGQDKTLFN
jgi:hypothetical protein